MPSPGTGSGCGDNSSLGIGCEADWDGCTNAVGDGEDVFGTCSWGDEDGGFCSWGSGGEIVRVAWTVDDVKDGLLHAA